MESVVVIALIGVIAIVAYLVYQNNRTKVELARAQQASKLAEIAEAQKLIEEIKNKSVRVVEEYQDARAKYNAKYHSGKPDGKGGSAS